MYRFRKFLLKYRDFIVMLCGIFFVLVLTLAAAVRFSTPLDGIPHSAADSLDTGWFYEEENEWFPIEQLPCSLKVTGNTLNLVRDISDMPMDWEDILTFRTRYSGIRVWADDRMIYEAAQGKDHALSSMWHFVPLEKCRDASVLRVEVTKYDQEEKWEVYSVLMDRPASIVNSLIRSYKPAILIWLFCLLFDCLLIFVIIFMVIQKIPGILTVLSLFSYVFLSGFWILLDSKITTIFGGNYALTYFLSYCIFYLLPVPFYVYIDQMMEEKTRILRYLSLAAVVNAALWMFLHLVGVVSIKKTSFTVHLLILISVVIFVRAVCTNKIKMLGKQKYSYSIFGIVIIYATGLLSIILYHLKLLPPTNSALLYSWSVLLLTLCMTMDAVSSVAMLWKEKSYIDRYKLLAIQDSMTMLANRNAYELRLQKIVSNPQERLTFVFFDVDNMKMINDTYGHHVGDQVIFQSARCIREVFDSSGDCYRIGGDEFCVILNSSDGVEKKLQEFDRLLKIRNRNSFPVDVSYGWEEHVFDGDKSVTMEEISKLKEAADKKLYDSKRRKKTEKEAMSGN